MPAETTPARIFAALGNEARCRIVELLREAGELRVGDIAAAFEMSLNGVSKHLKILEGAGLLVRRREGTTHFISIRWHGLTAAEHWLDAQRHAWSRRLDALEETLERRQKP
jgi:DNA-binding transcriptional ArsR family regulator